MPPEPPAQPYPGSPATEIVSPAPPTAAPPVLIAAPPMLVEPSTPKPSSVRSLLAFLLSVCLGLFLAQAILSLLDDSLILFFGVHLLTGISGILFLLASLVAILVYGLMAFLPMIPKRLFLPVTLFNPLAIISALPLLIYFYNRMQLLACGISLCQIIVALDILFRAQGGMKFRWPLIPESSLTRRGFTWRHLLGFVLANVFVLLPAAVVYLGVCTSLALSHATDGFVTLRPGGLVVQARKYTRPDGKVIHLVPMAHIGDAGFYRSLTTSFPTNAMILMEGVSDEHNLLTNQITYQRAAARLGLAEQQREFRPPEASMVRADVDVAEFTTNTIDFLNLIMLVHTKGLNAATLLPLLQYQPPPNFEAELFNDLLHKRNRHLLVAINEELAKSEILVVPWGAAHMPEIAREIQKSGFHLTATEDRTVIRFRFPGTKTKTVRAVEADLRKE